jgi:hypothetical protein
VAQAAGIPQGDVKCCEIRRAHIADGMIAAEEVDVCHSALQLVNLSDVRKVYVSQACRAQI